MGKPEPKRFAKQPWREPDGIGPAERCSCTDDTPRLSPIEAGPRRSIGILQRVAGGFAGADPQRVVDRRDENLAVADLAGAGAGGNDLDRLVGDVGRDRDFDPQLGQEIHDIFGAAINLGVALLAAVTLDLGHGHAADADGGERLAHLVELEGFDNGDNELHDRAFISKIQKRSRLEFAPRAIPASSSLASFRADGTKTCRSEPITIAVSRSPSVASCTGSRIIRQSSLKRGEENVRPILVL